MEINEESSYIIAKILDSYNDRFRHINIRFKGSHEDVYNLLEASMRAIATDDGIDFEEVISIVRFIYYSKLQGKEDQAEGEEYYGND